MKNQEFIQKGFSVFGTEDMENKLLSFLKAHYPNHKRQRTQFA